MNQVGKVEKTALKKCIADWLSITRDLDLPTGLAAQESGRCASELLDRIVQEQISPTAVAVDDDFKQLLSILISRLSDSSRPPEACLVEADAVHRFMERLRWPEDPLGEKTDLLLECEEIIWEAVGRILTEIAWGSLSEADFNAEPLPNTVKRISAPAEIDVNEMFRDSLCALIEELSKRPCDQPNFLMADRIYQFVAKLRWPADRPGERDEILHRLAWIGWRSSPGGMEAVKEARAKIWDRWDGTRYRDVSLGADMIRTRLEALKSQDSVDVNVLGVICSDVLMLASLRPAIAQSCALLLESILSQHKHRIGYLDERNHFIGVSAFATGTSSRHLSDWKSAAEWYRCAELALGKTVNLGDLDRVNIERLAFHLVRDEPEIVIREAPGLIQRVACPDEKAKAELTLASAQLSLGWAAEARGLLESALNRQDLPENNTIRVWLIAKLGSALSALGRYDEADRVFQEAIRRLQDFEQPILFSLLVADIGEHFTKRGRLTEAVSLYQVARQTYRVVGLTRFVAYLSVLLAELFMLLGRNAEAEVELLESLPVIEKLGMAREGIAAVALLKESLRRSKTDPSALRELREYLQKNN